MDYLMAAHTDIGLVKKVNQDALLIQKAETEAGIVLLAVLCDGMGGLSLGEVASACMIRSFSDWFRLEFPELVHHGFRRETLHESWEALVRSVSLRIRSYGQSAHTTLGTTCTALLMVQGSYYILNVGDSRIYLISDNIYQLTKDHTYVQQELDAGRLTVEEARTHPKQNILIQCIGAGSLPAPDYYFGQLSANQCFLLCCDGFRHVVTPQEFFERLNPEVSKDAESMKSNLAYLTQLNKQRSETDNITAGLIKVTG